MRQNKPKTKNTQERNKKQKLKNQSLEFQDFEHYNDEETYGNIINMALG
jgi:hypothetical protein